MIVGKAFDQAVLELVKSMHEQTIELEPHIVLAAATKFFLEQMQAAVDEPAARQFAKGTMDVVLPLIESWERTMKVGKAS